MNIDKYIEPMVITLILLIGVILVFWGLPKKGVKRIGIGFFIIMGLLLNTLIKAPNMATALTAFSTIALTLFAGVTIFLNFQTRKDAFGKEERDRKERLINEVIMWLKELEDRIFPRIGGLLSKQLQEEIDAKNKLGLSFEKWEKALDLEESLSKSQTLEEEIKEGEYIQRLSSGINSDLSTLIEVILKQLKRRRELVRYSLRHPQTIRDRDEKEDELTGTNTTLLGINAKTIRESVNKAIGKVVEIKTNLLSS